MSVSSALEHSEHISHAGHGGADSHGKPDNFSAYVGVTMAILGVVLAFASALVGSERTELVHSLVEQQHAHAKYQTQDAKHRMAFLGLSQIHATALATPAGAAAVNRQDVLMMAQTVNRYLGEAALAKDYTNSYDKLIQAHMDGQEEYELGLLLAEIGIVIASISLLMKRREPWYIAMVLGVAAMFIVGKTKVHVNHEVHASEQLVATAKATYEEQRSRNKTTEAEEQLVKSVIEWANGKTR